MAAGLGFKTFTSGEVLTAADVNGYLMQGVGVFTDAANRDAEITSPQEGQFAFLKDTNVTTYYTGSTWANLDTTGMTNPMTTTGDVIYSSSGSTPARLGIGTAGQVLQVNSGATAPEWAAPAGGWNPNYQLLNAGGTALTGASTITVSGISGKSGIYIFVDGASSASTSSLFSVQFNTDTGANYAQYTHQIQAASPNVSSPDYGGLYGALIYWATQPNAAGKNWLLMNVNGAGSSGYKICDFTSYADMYTGAYTHQGHAFYKGTSAISSVSLVSSSGNFDSGTLYVYGA